MRRPALVLCVVLLAAAPARAEEEVKLAGTVRDASDYVVPGAEVAVTWAVLGERLRGVSSATTNEAGQFTLQVKIRGWPIAVMAVDGRRPIGALAVLESAEQSAQPLELRLHPLVPIEGEVVCPDVDGPVTGVTVRIATRGASVGVWRTKGAKFSLLVPPADYALSISADDAVDVVRDVSILPGQTARLGKIEVKPREVARSFGKPAPALVVGEARGVPPDATWKAFEGKWVLLSFWAWHCDPCVKQDLPALARFYEAHAKDRDQFEVLAVHASDVGTLADLDARTKDVVANAWKGKALPFPVVLDGSGEMERRYSVDGYPETFLVDPQGRLVRDGTLEMLSEKLAEGDPEVNEVVGQLQTAKTPAVARPLLDKLVAKRTRLAANALVAWSRAATPALLPVAFEALGRLGGSVAVARLLCPDAIGAADPTVQEAAVSALGVARDPEAVDHLLAIVIDKKARPRLAILALDALGEIAPKDPRLGKWPAEASKSTNAEVKVAAIRLLGRIASDAAYARLVQVLQGDMYVAARTAAIAAITATGNPGAKAVLEKAASDDKAKSVREAAATAAASLAAPPAGG